MELFAYISENPVLLLRLALLHLGLVLVSAGAAVLFSLPLGIWLSRPANRGRISIFINLANVLQTVPSLAVIGLASAVFAIIGQGVGWWPAIAALFAYSILPVLQNTVNGLLAVPPAVMRAAVGLGMAPQTILRKVELPLAAPVIFAGVRTAAVINVGTAALAAAIGADCLGTLIFQGIATANFSLLLAGAIPTALLALLLDAALHRAEKIAFPSSPRQEPARR